MRAGLGGSAFLFFYMSIKVKDAPTQKIMALNKQFTKISNLPIKTLQAILNAVEPSVFTDANMKEICVRGKFEESVEQCARHYA